MGALTELLATTSPLILDGAMGTELDRRNVDIGLPLWSANSLINSPDVVLQIHKEYINAGADIITTNTFRTNRRAFRNARLADRSLELTSKAVELAKRAKDFFRGRAILIAGSIAPVEDCYRPDLVPTDAELQNEHEEHAERLATLGVDFLLIETMTTIREAVAACTAAKSTGKEVIVSFTCRPDGTLLGGEQLADAINAVDILQPTVFSLNCISPHHLNSLVPILRSAASRPFAVYCNIGKPDVRVGPIQVDVNADTYSEFARDWKDAGAAIIGGCCGTTPEYVKRLRETLSKR